MEEKTCYKKYQLMDTGGFHLLAPMNHAAIKTSVPGGLCTAVFYSAGCIPGSEIPGLYGNSTFNF